MRRYLVQSTGAHFALLLFYILFSFLRPDPHIIWLEGSGFDYNSGGGGDGRARAGELKKEKRGQPVPNPTRVPVPDKPAPVQKQQRAKEAWKVKDAKTKIIPKTGKVVDESIPIGKTNKKAQSNIIRRGTNGTSDAVEGYEYGIGGEGTGRGVGIGLGPGSGGGFGFGGYLSILRKRIWSEWTQYTTLGSNKSCVIALTVSKTGDVSNIKLETSSGDANYDFVARKAVRNASPLPPLPPGFPKPKQRFRIKFKLIE